MLNDHMWWKINLSDEEYKQMVIIHPQGNLGANYLFDLKTSKELDEYWKCRFAMWDGIG